MKYFYDLHIHSDLSPCGNSDMTPNNIVNMAYIKGLNIISVTDHNTARNFPAVNTVAKRLGIEVVPGMEVTTREEVHVLCYFKRYEDAEKFGELIYESLPEIENNILLFGEQNIYNSDDEITGSLNKLLINASRYSIDEVYQLVQRYHGISVPAHINKRSNSLLGILGFIPFNLKFDFVEIYGNEVIDKKLIRDCKVLKNSDAHMLENISEPVNSIELGIIDEIYEFLKLSQEGK